MCGEPEGSRKARRKSDTYTAASVDSLKAGQQQNQQGLAPIMALLQQELARPRLLTDDVINRIYSQLSAVQDANSQQGYRQQANRYARPGSSTRDGAFQGSMMRVSQQGAANKANILANLLTQQATEDPLQRFVTPALNLQGQQDQWFKDIANIYAGGAAQQSQIQAASQSQGGALGPIGQGIGGLLGLLIPGLTPSPPAAPTGGFAPNPLQNPAQGYTPSYST
jgi:hypothetical protein